MSRPDKTDPLKAKMWQAESALTDYFRSLKYDPEHEQDLAAAARDARQEYIHQLGAMWQQRLSLEDGG